MPVKTTVSTEQCKPISVRNLMQGNANRKRGLCCQICSFEGRSTAITSAVNVCLQHRIRCCTHVQPEKQLHKKTDDGDDAEVTKYQWRAPANLTCWEKAYRFYIPMGLFCNNVLPITEDDLNAGGKCFQHCKEHIDFRKRHQKLDLTGKRKKTSGKK